MKYIHTTSDVITRGTAKDVIRPYVSNYLFSLINGLSSENFGFNTIDRVALEVKRFKDDLYDNEHLFVDSAGYSIIVGDIPPKNINAFIECYAYFLEKYCSSHCDYIFSLDIPIFLKYPEVNTYSNLFKRNFRSNQLMRHILDGQPGLYDKLIFVWQFKLAEQYDIWKRIYEEFWSTQTNLKHFAIGGLVGLRGITGIKFSPYIGMLYNLLNIVYQKDLKDESILHILGVYGMHDRFHMAFLQRLFNDVYLKDRNPTVQISYDTINYFVSGLFKIRDLDSIIPLGDGTYLNDYNHNLVEHMDKIIKYPEALKSVIDNINCLHEDKALCDTRVYCYMNVVKQLICDQIMKDVVKQHELVNEFLMWDNFNTLKNNWVPLFKMLEQKYPFVFKNYTDKIMNNFQWIHSFHKWWVDGRDPVRLEKGMEM
ncbi:MAG: hypothetical protein R3250_05505, partial [Melioribacteraceae bacterium]|nr:hypothetical protein [Melioribacteraceae bacterium]